MGSPMGMVPGRILRSPEPPRAFPNFPPRKGQDYSRATGHRRFKMEERTRTMGRKLTRPSRVRRLGSHVGGDRYLRGLRGGTRSPGGLRWEFEGSWFGQARVLSRLDRRQMTVRAEGDAKP